MIKKNVEWKGDPKIRKVMKEYTCHLQLMFPLRVTHTGARTWKP